MDVSRLTVRLRFSDAVWDKSEDYLMSDGGDDAHHDFCDAYYMYIDIVNDNLERWFVQQVLGTRDPYKGGITEAEIEKIYPAKHNRRAHGFMPVYHSTNIPLPNSNWEPPVEWAPKQM